MIRRSKIGPADVVPLPDVGEGASLFEADVDLRAVTPIFKGSARPDGVDEDYPFRGPSLRGQLRTWWRAVHPTTDVNVLRAEERKLFGGIHVPGGKAEPRASRVTLGVADMGSEVVSKNDLRRRVGSSLPYATWVDRDGDNGLYHVDAVARVHVSARSVGGEDLSGPAGLLDKALRAMVLFGASGARSRRGLGRLWSDALFGPMVSDAAALARLIGDLAPPPGDRTWPTLAGASVAWKRGLVAGRAAEAAEAALEDLKDLRGMRSLGGRNFDGSHRLREAQEDWLKIRDHRPLGDAFTAALGMPVLYRSNNNHLQGVTTVAPKHGDRLPSPLHVRPVPVAGGWAAVILALHPWYTGPIAAKNRRMGQDQSGRLRSDAVAIALDGLAARGWDIAAAGGVA